jgi:hypothetical protein
MENFAMNWIPRVRAKKTPNGATEVAICLTEATEREALVWDSR